MFNQYNGLNWVEPVVQSFSLGNGEVFTVYGRTHVQNEGTLVGRRNVPWERSKYQRENVFSQGNVPMERSR